MQYRKFAEKATPYYRVLGYFEALIHGRPCEDERMVMQMGRLTQNYMARYLLLMPENIKILPESGNYTGGVGRLILPANKALVYDALYQAGKDMMESLVKRSLPYLYQEKGWDLRYMSIDIRPYLSFISDALTAYLDEALIPGDSSDFTKLVMQYERLHGLAMDTQTVKYLGGLSACGYDEYYDLCDYGVTEQGSKRIYREWQLLHGMTGAKDVSVLLEYMEVRKEHLLASWTDDEAKGFLKSYSQEPELVQLFQSIDRKYLG